MTPNGLRTWALYDGGKFRDFPDAYQQTVYTCGPATLRSALAWYGHEVDEATLADELDTTPQDGTTIANMVKVARAYGVDAEAREHLTIADLESAIARGDVVIVVLQAWKNSGPPVGGYTNEWNEGHYVIPVAIDRDAILFEDPSVVGSRVYLTTAEFMDRWHDIDTGHKLHHAGILLHGVVTGIVASSPTLGEPVSMR